MSDTPPPPPPGFDSTSTDIPPPEGVEVHESDVLRRRKKFSWRNFGGDGFLVSVAFHVILLLLGIFFVIQKYTEPKKPDTEIFATGAGGGANGDKAKIFEHKMRKKVATPMKTPSRIVSKSANAALALPNTPSTSSAAFASGLASGGMSKGSGGGSGGGDGTGMGIGKGGGKNFLGSFLGMKMAGNAKVAVYMDASGSMTPYLDRVEAEAKKIFPEADVFRVNAIQTFVENGKVVGGYGTQKSSSNRTVNSGLPGIENDPKNFSALGKRILRDHLAQFEMGSVGAWFDTMITEKYDALIIFSDFNDGIMQRNAAHEVIFSETMSGGGVDTRKSGDKAWENRWYKILEKAKAGGAPKVYCFSINTEPQPVWKKCTEVSGGAVKMVRWLTQPGGKPPEEDGEDVAASINKGARRGPAPIR